VVVAERGAAHTGTRRSRLARVKLLGDSFTQGIDTLAHQMARDLDA
jgi:hypothetical protein